MKWVTLCMLLALLATVCSAKPKSKTRPHTARSSRSLKPTSRIVAARHRRNARQLVPPKPPAPTYQLHPDEERYQTIQKALADRGYFKGEPNGQWGDDSIDALKRFQADQKLLDDGKINSLSLIALGLGPKHDGSSLSAVQPQFADSAPSSH